MRYVSTRGGVAPMGFSEAVAAGLAPDGGLLVPEELPDLSKELAGMGRLGYAQLCARFLSRFADIPEVELSAMAARSYAGFDRKETAPILEISEDVHVLELFHGPTLAFKDFALQLLGNLYERQCALSGESINVVGASSGDTGAAAIHGLLGKPRAAVFILYPNGRVSPLQERQMACTGAANVHALAVSGSFDDTQAILKQLLGDPGLKARLRLTAVNSISIARVLAQCVYYLYAWLQLPAGCKDSEFVVPTGNFGNVLAGWMLQKMGVPLRGFRVATNQNDILHRFFTTGEYRIGQVRPSLAPSMDIQVASNFERFLYYSMRRDGARTARIMAQIRTTGAFMLPDFDRDTFTSSSCTDAEINGIIRQVHRAYGYIVDPHTACAFKDMDFSQPSVVLATAHPAKFPDTIRTAIGIEPTHPSLEALKGRPLERHEIVADAGAIRAFIESRAV
ncbi:MAG TPA: threonine synthase [Opitutaceae bacterium]|jgi:threonine synthase